MKIVIVSKDKSFIQKIKEDFKQFSTLQNILFVVYRKAEDVRIENLVNEGIQCVFIDTDYVATPIEFANSIKEMHPSIDIVFLGSSCENSYALYEVDHVGFIYKSAPDKYITIIGHKIIQRAEQKNSCFIKIHWKNTVYVVENCDILYVERDKRKTLIHTVYGEVYTTYQHIDQFVDELGKVFLRIHFSYLVNSSYVKEFHRNHLILTNDIFVPISRKFAKEIKEYYGETDMI